jgi:hypothetical protein
MRREGWRLPRHSDSPADARLLPGMLMPSLGVIHSIVTPPDAFLECQ